MTVAPGAEQSVSDRSDPLGRILFVTQVADPNDPVLGFSLRWAEALRDEFSRVTFVANEVREAPDGMEIVSLGKERGSSRAVRSAKYLQVIEEATRYGCDAILAHMCPDYANLAAPFARLRRVPLLLWFAHPARGWELRVAERLVDRIVTSLPRSYPGDPRKLRRIGQATDVERLQPSPLPPRDRGFRFVAVGRTSPSKGFDTIIRAVARLVAEGQDIQLRIVGPSSTAEERSHRRFLVSLVEELDLADRVRLDPGLPHAEVAAVIREAHVLVNAMVAGSGDKVVFEAMALERPVVVSNPSFRPMLADVEPSPLFPEGDLEVLTDRLRTLAGLPDSQLADVGALLRRRVVAGHSLETWARGVASVVRETHGQ